MVVRKSLHPPFAKGCEGWGTRAFVVGSEWEGGAPGYPPKDVWETRHPVSKFAAIRHESTTPRYSTTRIRCETGTRRKVHPVYFSEEFFLFSSLSF
jgi:hypothetical protein